MRTPRQAIEEALKDGITRVAVANFIRGVVLPPEFSAIAWVPLNLSLSFHAWCLPEFRDDGIQVTLTFQGKAFDCFLPYRSIGRVADSFGAVEVFEVHGEVRAGAFAGQTIERKAMGRDVAVTKEQRPSLRLIKGGAA